MAMVVSKQLEADNNHESEVGTISFVEIATNHASKEAEIKPLMIRLYKEIMRPMSIQANQGKDDNIDGSAGSKSLIDELARVNAYKEGDMELMSRIYNETIRPLILADIEAKHQHFLSLVREKFDVNFMTGMIWEYGNMGRTSGQAWQLQFKNEILAPVSTGVHIKGEDNSPLLLVLVDAMSGEIVKTGAGAAIEVEIVVLDGDSNDDEAENWTSDEFSSKIVRERKGKKVLQGKTIVKMKEGVGLFDNISFTHNKDWKRMKNCRLGARPVNADFSASVKPGKTKVFRVVDKRTKLYNKHPIPTLLDDVWRLYKVGRRGSLVKSLLAAKIKTVGDFIVRLFLDPQCLHEIFDAAKQAKNLEITTKHAQKCPAKLKYSSDKKIEVVFNVSGEVLGLYLDSQFFQRDMLPCTQKEFAKNLVSSAFKNWENVVTINDDQSSTYLPNKSIFLNGIDLIIDESSLFGNMLSAGQRPNSDFVCESLRTRYNEIYYELESVCTSNQHQPGPGLALVCTKVSQENRFCKRWRMLFCVVTFTIGSLTKKCSRDSHVHKKRKLS